MSQVNSREGKRNAVETGPSVWEQDHWYRLQELYHLAGNAPPGERTRILQQACSDPAVVDRVLELLAASPEKGSAPSDGQAVPLGSRVGPYALLRHLGTGGLGSVYLAERMAGGAVQQCALKVLSMHAAGPQFESRFLREQQILARLNHPHITRMLDAGFSETNQPYLTMEYVDGVDVVRYCDERRLNVAARIELFLQICDAVSYAHRNTTVHLDLKPSNVLVSIEGEVKLLDFGTSKLIDPDSTSTTTVLATPAYASPEQLRNEPVTTACDVYGLGALLYELLAGARPWGDSSPTAMLEHALREDEPASLTAAVTDKAATDRSELSAPALRQRLRGDLAGIVARCLRSRAASRYRSVDALRDEVRSAEREACNVWQSARPSVRYLRRYLDGLPVLARPQTARYRMAKFLRRQWKPVTVASLALLLVVGSLVYAAWRQHQALRAADRAVQMQTFMSQLFRLANTNYMGKPAATVPEFLQLGAKVLPDMIRNPSDQRSAALSLAESMYNNTDYKDAQAALTRIISESRSAGDVATEAEAEGFAGRVAYKLSDLKVSKTLAERALELAHAPGVTPAARVWIVSFYTQDRYEQEFSNDEDVRLQRAAVAEARKGAVPEDELAYAALDLAFLLERHGELKEQEDLAEEALAIYRREPYAICERAGAAELLGVLRQQTGKLQESVDLLRTSFDGYRQCAGENSRDTLEVAGYLALAMVAAHQTPQAVPLLEDTIPRLEKAAGSDSLVLKAPLLALARAYVDTGRFPQASATAARLVHLVSGKINPLSVQMGAYELVWARALQGEGKNREALQHAELADKAYAADSSNLRAAQENAARSHQLVADLRAKLGAAK